MRFTGEDALTITGMVHDQAVDVCLLVLLRKDETVRSCNQLEELDSGILAIDSGMYSGILAFWQCHISFPSKTSQGGQVSSPWVMCGIDGYDKNKTGTETPMSL